MMKLSANSLGIFVLTAITTTAFVWMAKRPPVEGYAIKFGMPLASSTEEMAKEKPKILETSEENVAEESNDNTNNNEATTEVVNQASTDEETSDAKKAAKDKPNTRKE